MNLGMVHYIGCLVSRVKIERNFATQCGIMRYLFVFVSPNSSKALETFRDHLWFRLTLVISVMSTRMQFIWFMAGYANIGNGVPFIGILTFDNEREKAVVVMGLSNIARFSPVSYRQAALVQHRQWWTNKVGNELFDRWPLAKQNMFLS